jgi:hypothetical protein
MLLAAAFQRSAGFAESLLARVQVGDYWQKDRRSPVLQIA